MFWQSKSTSDIPSDSKDKEGSKGPSDQIDDEHLLRLVLTPGVNYYEIFRVPNNANGAEIRRAYKALALKFHPDKYNGPNKDKATEAFQQINQAYQTLNDPQQRREYDVSITNNKNGSNNGGNTSTADAATGIAAATIFTGFLAAFVGSKQTAENIMQDNEVQKQIKSMLTFLTVVKEELNITDEFIVQSGSVIMKGFADVFVDILPFLLQAARRSSPQLVWKLSAAAAIGALFARDDVFKLFDWNSMNPATRGMVVDGLLYFYQNKLTQAST